MKSSSKWYLAGFASATILFLAGAIVMTNLRDAMIRSKSKRLFAETRYLDECVLRYRDQHGEYPRSKQEVISAQELRYATTDFDYFEDHGHYTLIYPSLTGTSRWEPYVIQDGRLAAFPVYMDEDVARMHLRKGAILPRLHQ